MEDSIFTKIIKREIPAEIIYEDQDTVAFLDQMPDNEGHTLVVPRKQVRNIFDTDLETFLAVMKTAHTLAPKIKAAVGADGMRVCLNNEPAGGQVVFHLHAHLIPYFDSAPATFPPKERVTPEILNAAAEKIRPYLA